MKKFISRLYHGTGTSSTIFRFGMLTFDIVSILFFIFISMQEQNEWIYRVDLFIAAVIGLDLLARLYIAPKKTAYLFHWITIADLIVIVSLIAPLFFSNLLFLRVLRALRLLRSYHVMRDLRENYDFFKRNEEVIQAVLNLFVFVFIMTAIVYVLQEKQNPLISNYIDALYFTVATLSTTGFGDVTLVGNTGRMLAIFIMVFGVALFLRMLQTIFRPKKVRYICKVCGLNRHEADAVHCKHCGTTIHIANEGDAG